MTTSRWGGCARAGDEEVVIEARKDPFLGDLVLLVNARSASASEVLARTVQMAKRGVVSATAPRAP